MALAVTEAVLFGQPVERCKVLAPDAVAVAKVIPPKVVLVKPVVLAPSCLVCFYE